MKLRTKIQLFLSLVMVLSIVLVNTAIYFLFVNISLDAEQERIHEEANSIMEALATNKQIGVDTYQLLRAYVPSNGIIRIINDKEEMIESVSKQVNYYNLPYTFIQSEKLEIFESDDGERYVIASIPLIWVNGEIVTLQVTEHLVSFQDTMTTLQIVLFIASIIMVVPVVVMGRGLATFLIKPIQQLTRSMINNPQHGEWKKIQLNSKSKDELYQMGTTYNQMIDRLNESVQKQEQFVSDASHELKTPIAVIQSYTQLVARRGKNQPELKEEAIVAIDSESNRMQHLTEQMLSLAKNQQKDKLQFKEINIVMLLKDVIRSLSMAHHREITLDVDTNLIYISVDMDKVKQALYILIDNACKYSEDLVQVRIDQSDRELQIAVTDTGEGIDQSELVRIFDRFYRIDKARSRETGGTGLGLSIAKHIVEAHGGMITVNSQLNEGTTFTIHFFYHEITGS